MVDAYAVWCGPCKQLDRMTFADPTVGAWARKNVVAVKVDAEKGEGRRLSQRYAVRAFPTILFLDASGNELDRISGVFPPADFIKAGDSILTGKTADRRGDREAREARGTPLSPAASPRSSRRGTTSRVSAPLARRAVEEDPELLEAGARETFLYLVSLEDGAEKLSAETLDLIESLAPRLSADPRVVILRLAASREQTRRGDATAARASALAGLKGLPEDSPFAADLYAALAVRGAGRRRSPRPPSPRRERPSPSARSRGAAPGPAPPGSSPSPRRSRSPARTPRRGRRSTPRSVRRRPTRLSSRAPPRSSSC